MKKIGNKMNHWIYNGNPFLEPIDWGFIYLITNTKNNKKYIGKKQFYFKKYKTVKGKRKGYFVESDWKEYWSSSEEVKKDILEIGNEFFIREILKLCKTKSECSYWEAKYQFEYDVLYNPNDYYNQWISVRVSRKNLIRA